MTCLTKPSQYFQSFNLIGAPVKYVQTILALFAVLNAKIDLFSVKQFITHRN